MGLNNVPGLITLILVASLLIQCASPKPLVGGPKDTTPPRVIEERSTPNQQTNFTADQIIIEFDEWIKLDDVYGQLVISPPMPEEPEVAQKGKAIVIDLPDSLRDETTYTINFGNAITDLNEGNAVENYVYVFSTGDVLDSNSVSGTVIDALTLQPVDDIWVMMYFTGNDSAVFFSKPDYVARTNAGGKWSISFLPADSFLVVALKDENLNFLYDQEGEYFGWADEVIYTGTETEVKPLILFPREKRSLITDVLHTAPGWLKIVVDAPFPKPLPVLNPPVDESLMIWHQDTLNVWYDPDIAYSGNVVLNNDTTRIRPASVADNIQRKVILKPVTGRIKPGTEAIFMSSIPVTNLDASYIQIHHDSLGSIPVTVSIDSTDQRLLKIGAAWTGGTRYPLVFLPGAITDYWGRTNDTIHQSIVVNNEDQYGDLFISVDGLDSTKQFIVLLKEGDIVRHSFVVADVSSARIINRGLLPGKYTIEIVEDTNRNGHWDTGNYDLRRQPEKKMIFTPEALRAAWEQEVQLMWKL